MARASSERLRSVLERLSRHCFTAVVSGRDRRDVQELVQLDELVYAGSHGFDIAGPGGLRMEHAEGARRLPALEAALASLGIPVLEIGQKELEQVGFRVLAQGAGIDRLVNGYAAWQKWKRDLVVVDLGTATTFDVVASPGVFLGGAIFTGLELCAKALAQNAEALFEVPLEFPKQIIGKNTREALQSGILFGYSSLVETMLERARELLAHGATLFGIATGGLAHVLYDQTAHLDRWEPTLTLEGLAGLAQDERINGNLKPRVGHG